MQLDRRRALLAVLALPAGCAIQPLAPLSRAPIATPAAGGALRAPSPGQSWTYQKLNFFNGVELDVVEETVDSVGPAIVVRRRSANGLELADERHAAWGQLLRESCWDYPMSYEQPAPLWPTELVPGARLAANTHYRMDGGSFRYWIQLQSVVQGWERVTIAAGTFDTLRIERLVRLNHADHTRIWTLRRDTMWLSLEIGRWVVRETDGRYQESGDIWLRQPESREDHFRWVLTGWR